MSGAVPLAYAATFALAAALALRAGATICARTTPFADGPRPGRAPVAALVCGPALLGAVLGARGAGIVTAALALVVCAALAASWYSDVRCGIIPDSFTLAPLAAVLVVFACERNFAPFASVAVVLVPFAAAAAFSKGLGMGWGDVKLVALGGAVLGLPVSLLACAAACLLAAAVALVTRRRHEPIAFAPYLAGSIAAGLLVPALR